MRPWYQNVAKPLVPSRITNDQLGFQVLPLKGQLSSRYGNRAASRPMRHLRFVEVIPPPDGLGDHVAKIGCDDSARVRVVAKSFQLWMPCVAARASGQNCLREQALAPERDQPFGIEVLRMEGPEAHGSGFIACRR